MKTIQVTIDEPLLHRLDDTARREELARSTWIREVIADALWQRDLDQLNKQDREAYAAVPQTDEEINGWIDVQARDDDDWYSDDDWPSDANGPGGRA